jgi:hypothetical protein
MLAYHLEIVKQSKYLVWLAQAAKQVLNQVITNQSN